MKLSLPALPDASGLPERLCRADELGLFFAPGDSPGGFQLKLDAMRQENDYSFPDDAKDIPDGIREEAVRKVFNLYGFRPDWLPAYCSGRETGHFSAGVTLILNERIPLVFLSGAFLKKKRHRGYSASETLAHEMVHAVRTSFPQNSAYDEFFPCQVHDSIFRRLAGNLFRRREIPVLFFTGLVLAALHPAFLLIPLSVLLRELQLHVRIRSAAKKLREIGLRPEPVLLRLGDEEIKMLAKGRIPPDLSDPASLRRTLYYRRFPL